MVSFRIDRRLKADFSRVLLGNLVYAACQWGIIWALANLGTPEQVGDYAFAMAVCGPLVLFGNLQLRSLIVSDVEGRFDFAQYLRFRIVSLGIVVFLIFTLAAGIGIGDRTWILLVVGCAQILESFSDLYYGWMQKHERLDRVAASLLMKGPFALGLLAAVMFFTHNVAWSIAGLAFGRLVILLAWDARLNFVLPRKIESSGVAQSALALMPLALPLGIIASLTSLNVSVPRYFLEADSGRAALGIFSALASLVNGGSLVVAALGQSVFLSVAKAYATGNREKFRGLALHAVLLGLMLGGAAVLVSLWKGREVLATVFGNAYGDEADVLAWLMIGATITFIASGLGYVITAARSLVPQIPLLLATVAVSAVISAWAVPRYGLYGAAGASILSAVVQLAGTMFLLFRLDRRMMRIVKSGEAPDSSIEMVRKSA